MKLAVAFINFTKAPSNESVDSVKVKNLCFSGGDPCDTHNSFRVHNSKFCNVEADGIKTGH